MRRERVVNDEDRRPRFLSPPRQPDRAHAGERRISGVRHSGGGFG